MSIPALKQVFVFAFRLGACVFGRVCTSFIMGALFSLLSECLCLPVDLIWTDHMGGQSHRRAHYWVLDTSHGTQTSVKHVEMSDYSVRRFALVAKAVCDGCAFIHSFSVTQLFVHKNSSSLLEMLLAVLHQCHPKIQLCRCVSHLNGILDCKDRLPLLFQPVSYLCLRKTHFLPGFLSLEGKDWRSRDISSVKLRLVEFKV